MISTLAFRVLVPTGFLFIALLVSGCGDPDKEVSLADVKKAFGQEQPNDLVKMAFDPDDPDRRREGVVGLSEKKWGLQEPYLKGYAALLKSDDDPLVRSAAVRALGKAGDVHYLPNVIAALEDKSASVRWDAAVALDILIGEDAIAPLRSHLEEDNSMDVRASCARALRHYRRQEVFESLRFALRDEDFSVRYQARQSLIALTGLDLGAEPNDWPDDTLAAGGPPENAKRPWWDWMKVTKSQSREEEPAEPQPIEPESDSSVSE